MSTIFRDRSRVDAMTSQVEAPSRIMAPAVGNTTFRSCLVSQDFNRLNMRLANSNNVDYIPDQKIHQGDFIDSKGHRTSIIQNTTFGMRPVTLQSQNLTSHSTQIIPEGSFRLNQDIRLRNGNMPTNSKTFWPAVRNTTLTTGLQMQDRVRINNDTIDNGGFRRPTFSKEIRGRNSTLSSRLFHPQSMDRHYKDLSNINGFNVSHISLRDGNQLSESRLALHMRGNCMDNQSISGSVFSVVSMKAQFLNLLENLHHSILSIGPHITSEAVRLQFDKAKQGLENLSEMSFAASVRPADAASVISHSCKSICPQINESTALNTIDGGLVNLKSATDLLKTLTSDKDSYKNKQKLLTRKQESTEKVEIITSTKNFESDDEEDSSFVFKKPRPLTGKRKGAKVLKIKASAADKNSTSKGTSKVINLKHWYPVAVGSDLAFCGVDEKGVSVKTDAVKKRLNNRKVVLISGVDCNLIGSPSTTGLPEKIMKFLKNGLTDRWKVFQKELSNYQMVTEEESKKKSISPPAKRPQWKKTKVKTPEESKTVKNTPRKKEREVYTRSGRAVKPPPMFWLVSGKEEIKSSLSKSHESSKKGRKSHEGSPVKESERGGSLSPSKNPKRVGERSPRKREQKVDEKSRSKTPKKADEESPRTKSGKVDGSPSRRVAASELVGTPSKRKKDSIRKVVVSPKKKETKVKSPRKSRAKEEVKIHSTMEDAEREVKSRNSPSKRKREVSGDADSVQAKKMKNGLTPSPGSPKPKRQKLPRARNKKETAKKGRGKNAVVLQQSTNQTEDLTDVENNFDFNLDDIGIPEIANRSDNPQLSRSQLRTVCMETPPLKYFNSNLKLMRSATPVRSPDWFLSQRTESEVKQFQKRREEAFKKKIMKIKKTVITEKSKTVQSKDVKQMLEWLDEKTVRSPQWTSKVLQYVIPSRKQMEEEDDRDFEA